VTKKLLRIRAVCVQREAIMADDFSNTFVWVWVFITKLSW
jgi:hypothetical protein